MKVLAQYLCSVLLIVCFIALTACTRAQPTLPKADTEIGITILDTSVGDADWSRDGKTIAYAKRATDGYFDIWASKPDGGDKRCLTCGKNFSRRHRGSVTQHPAGNYIVFTTENEDVRGQEAEARAHPGIGMNTNLWAVRSDGSQAWKLTDLPTDYRAPRGMIHPQFSRDGRRLVWTEALGKYSLARELAWGEWTLALADFQVVNGAPVLKNIRRFQPGEQHAFYETHDWLPDDGAILFSGNLKRGQPVNADDIYEYAIATERLTQLTNTFEDWDEHAHYSPDGKMIAWMSGADLHVEFPEVRRLEWQKYVKTELWLMDRDGSNQRRVTFFNKPGHRDYEWFQKNVYKTDRVVVSDSAFSPDGKKLVVTLAYEGPASAQYGNVRSVLVVVDLEKRASDH
jgi:Tol biopolymer transport system component